MVKRDLSFFREKRIRKNWNRRQLMMKNKLHPLKILIQLVIVKVEVVVIAAVVALHLLQANPISQQNDFIQMILKEIFHFQTKISIS